MSNSDFSKWIEDEFGVLRETAFSSEAAPRSPDESEIRSYLQGTLDTALHEEIFWLTITFREWADVRDRIALEQFGGVPQQRDVYQQAEWPAWLDQQEQRDVEQWLTLEYADLIDELPLESVTRADPLRPYEQRLRDFLVAALSWHESRNELLQQSEKQLVVMVATLLRHESTLTPFPSLLTAVLLVRRGLGRFLD